MCIYKNISRYPFYKIKTIKKQKKYSLKIHIGIIKSSKKESIKVIVTGFGMLVT